MARRKLIIDTDAGIDDAQAILMALAYPQEVEILAMTTTHGNTSCNQVTRNVLRLLKVAGRLDIPVYRGASKPLVGKRVAASDYHGNDGFGDVPDEEAPGLQFAQSERAIQAMLRLVDEHPGEIELVCLGPLTNLALAVRTDPEFGTKIKHCYIMGGNYEGVGNETEHAEFNFYCDPESAHIVLTELGCDITMACWELCLKYAFDWEWYHENYISIPTTKAEFIKHIETYTIDNFYKPSNRAIYETPDQLLIAVALDSCVCLDLVKASATVECQDDVTRGRMNVEWCKDGNGANVGIVRSIDEELFSQMMNDLEQHYTYQGICKEPDNHSKFMYTIF